MQIGQTYVLATEAIAVLGIRRHLWLPLKPLYCLRSPPVFTNRKTGKSVNKSNSAETPTGSQGPGQDQTELNGTLDLNMKAWNRRNFIWPTFPQLTPLNLMKRVVKKPKSQMPQILLSHTHFHKTPGISAKIPVFWKCRQILSWDLLGLVNWRKSGLLELCLIIGLFDCKCVKLLKNRGRGLKNPGNNDFLLRSWRPTQVTSRGCTGWKIWGENVVDRKARQLRF